MDNEVHPVITAPGRARQEDSYGKTGWKAVSPLDQEE